MPYHPNDAPRDQRAIERADRSFANACIAIGLVLIFALATWTVGSTVHKLHRPQANVIAQQGLRP